MDGATQRISYRRTAAVAVDGTQPWRLERLITTAGGRWSRPAAPTIYLAADPGVALAEYSRHLPAEDATLQGSIWTLRLRLEGAADLRDADAALVLDKERCRALADELRRRGLPGLVVPSVAFLDDRARHNVVVFADVVGNRVSEMVQDPRLVATIAAADAVDERRSRPSEP